MDGPQTLGQIIRSRRQALRLTQEELAARIGGGVRQAEISRLESDRITLPRKQRLERIAAALELPLGELLAGAGWTGADRAFATNDVPASVPLISRLTARPDRPALEHDRAANQEEAPERLKLREAIAHSNELRLRTAALLQTSTELAAVWEQGRISRPIHTES